MVITCGATAAFGDHGSRGLRRSWAVLALAAAQVGSLRTCSTGQERPLHNHLRRVVVVQLKACLAPLEGPVLRILSTSRPPITPVCLNWYLARQARRQQWPKLGLHGQNSAPYCRRFQQFVYRPIFALAWAAAAAWACDSLDCLGLAVITTSRPVTMFLTPQVPQPGSGSVTGFSVSKQRSYYLAQEGPRFVYKPFFVVMARATGPLDVIDGDRFQRLTRPYQRSKEFPQLNARYLPWRFIIENTLSERSGSFV